MRERIYEIIGEVTDEDSDKLSHYYDMVMVVVIIASLIPMMFKKTNFGFEVMTCITSFAGSPRTSSFAKDPGAFCSIRLRRWPSWTF